MNPRPRHLLLFTNNETFYYNKSIPLRTNETSSETMLKAVGCVDLALVSSAFENIEVGKRCRIIKELLPVKIYVGLLLYAPEEFERLKKKSIIL